MVIGSVTCLGLVRKVQARVIGIIFEISAFSVAFLRCHTVPLQRSKVYLLALSTPQVVHSLRSGQKFCLFNTLKTTSPWSFGIQGKKKDSFFFLSFKIFLGAKVEAF